jgi:ATP-dependent helicase/nuclease subunit A
MVMMALPERAFERNDVAISHADFVRSACDPGKSVVIEACAGSGKTWLLVARMLRLLLAGAQPAELLAITFTRKAAQEMRERLMHLLLELALESDQKVIALLQERGIAGDDVATVRGTARNLYEHVLASPSALSIDTFHSWFARLIQIAPLASGVPHGYSLTESSAELLAEAYRRFLQTLNDDDHAEVKQALLQLYASIGDWNTRKLLDAFADKRAEWWAANQQGHPFDSLAEMCGEDGIADARLRLWDDAKLLASMQEFASIFGQATPTLQGSATKIEMALTAGASLESFEQLMSAFFTASGEPRKMAMSGKLLAAVKGRWGDDGPDRFGGEFEDVCTQLQDRQRRSGEVAVLAMNCALQIVGSAYLECYQEVKAEQRVFDFADLEWQAYRLLNDPEQAAYIQSRLDARYKHILLDEFQDTNPLQWSIVRAWLRAYGDDESQPSVFVVGDPKQSIYRFRRAEPRVFKAASDMLASRGASVLRTNQTRRNARTIIDVLNVGMAGNRIFSPQTTLSPQAGAVWRLPLARVEVEEEAAEQETMWRNPLDSARVEQEDDRRYEEGRVVAAALIAAREELTAERGEAVKWSDVMLLVKKRAHLGAYEKALREAGIPFISDKRGGLLDSLEVADLIALLTFLITPGDNLALAHVLKSPIVGADDEALIALAEREERVWWQRLQAATQELSPPPLQRAQRLLTSWLKAAPHLPVHDLLDLILHEGDLLARYAQCANPMARNQVIGNIEAFIELSLALDAGRYPSLPKFIDALQNLRKGEQRDTPDEANVDAAIDAARILTIHSSKGLEAPIVVLLDANHSEPARDDAGVLCDWPQDEDAPTHFSAFGRKDERGVARDKLFEAEETFKAQEDWNLLYVAATRAKNILIISGVAGARKADEHGVVKDSWYARLIAVPEKHCEQAEALVSDQHDVQFEMPIYAAPKLPAEQVAEAVVKSDAIDEGILLHGLLERLTHASKWPVTVPSHEIIGLWLACDNTVAATIAQQARTILTTRELERFFDPGQYLRAFNEFEVAVDGQMQRFDRLVRFADEIWILDYKRQLLDSERSGYKGQLARYRRAAQAVFPGVAIRSALITVDGKLWEFTD